MPLYVLAKTRAEVATLLVGASDGASLTIAAGQVFLSWKAFPGTDAYSHAYNAGVPRPFIMIGMTTGSLDYTKTGLVGFPLMLYVAKSKEADWDGNDIEDLKANILAKLLSITSYSSGIAPQRVYIEAADYEAEVTPGLVMTRFRYEFMDPILKKDAVEIPSIGGLLR